MSITATWDNDDQNILRFEIDGKWSWRDFYRANDDARALMDDISHPVNLIFDLQHGDWLPKGTLHERLKLIAVNTHPHYGGVTVYVGDEELTEVFDGILAQAYAQCCAMPITHFVPSLDAAHDLLARRMA